METFDQVAFAERLSALRSDVAAQLELCKRSLDSLKICGVSKRQPRLAVEAAIASGLSDVGENYAQEAVPKLDGLSGVTKHFLGHLQTNKAKLIVGAFDVIQSIDRIEAGLAVARASQALGRGVRVLIQVNISPTERYGVAPHEAGSIAQTLRQAGLDVDGVMAIGPISQDPAIIRRSFEEAASCFAEVGGSTFSIGMSSDWREAIACGSTMIRIGTALFGSRDYTSKTT